MYKPGDVFRHFDWLGDDGKRHIKLFVVLNDFTADCSSLCLSLITTSQPKPWYEGTTKGCYPHKAVFVIPPASECFPQETRVLMPGRRGNPIESFNLAEMIKNSIEKIIKLYGTLNAVCLRELKNCLKKFKDDIAPEHLNILFPK